MGCSLPGSSIHGIFHARILEWVATSFSRRSSQPRDWTWVSCIVGRCFTIWATREVTKSWKCTKYLNIKTETVTSLEENIGKNLVTLVLAKDFLDMTPKAQATKSKISKWDYTILKSFCITKEMINKMKMQHKIWEKIFTNHISDKKLI